MNNLKYGRSMEEEAEEEMTLPIIIQTSMPDSAMIMGSGSQQTRQGNRIYFYDEVDRHSTLRLIQDIKHTTSELTLHSARFEQDPPPINLHIQSGGGHLLSGLAAADYIKKNPLWINTIVDGYAASAATLMSVMGDHRQITENSYMLIHQLSTMFWGTYENQKDEMQNSDKFMQSCIKIYEERTKLSKKKLEKLLKHDLWLSAKECLKYGLVDEIV